MRFCFFFSSFSSFNVDSLLSKETFDYNYSSEVINIPAGTYEFYVYDYSFAGACNLYVNFSGINWVDPYYDFNYMEQPGLFFSGCGSWQGTFTIDDETPVSFQHEMQSMMNDMYADLTNLDTGETYYFVAYRE